MKPKVIVLGAGTFQVGLIAFLNQEGFETHAVSNRRSEAGIGKVHQCHFFSYQEIEKVLELAKSLNAVQIFSVASEASLYCQAFVQSQMGWNGFTLKFISDFTFKYTYKKYLQEVVPSFVPRVLLSKENESLELFYAQCDDGVIQKPITGSGSNQITYIDNLPKFNELVLHEKDNSFLLEEFISGQEYGGDFIVRNEEIVFYLPTLKYKNEHWVPTTHLVSQNREAERIISPLLEKVTSAMSLPDGIYNVDIIIKNSQPYLIDLSPRIGGNCIPDLTYRSTGVNEWLFLKQLLLDEPISEISFTKIIPHGVFLIGSEEKGEINFLSNNMRPFETNLVEVLWRIAVGDQVNEFCQGGDHLGYVIYSAANDKALLEMKHQVESYQWFTLA